MPRIYAFAKELGFENKKLLDICEKLGIQNKGSALASLDDDEVSRIKKYLAEGPSEPPAPEKPTPAKPAAPQRTESVKKGPVKVLDGPRKKREPTSTKETPKEKSAPKKPAVNVKLASMPDAKQPDATKPTKNEKIQKPDMALPPQAIRDAMLKASKERKGPATKGSSPLKQFNKRPDKQQDSSFDPSALQQPPASDSPLSGRRRTKKGKEQAEPGVDSEMGSVRQARRPARNKRVNVGDQEQTGGYRRRRSFQRKGPAANTAAPRKDKVVLEMPCTVRSFSEGAGVGKNEVLKVLMAMGQMANINSELDLEAAQFIAAELNIDLAFREQESLEDSLISRIEETVDTSESLVTRPPVVTFLGHVDHGKTSLLDALIGIDVVSGEAGGITQHIRAYQIDKNGQKIAFVDTPGHEAFTEMRARGANVTDIAVLVVAADDGVMPQTEEAISHVKAADVPIIVALNKIDLPGANADKALQDLAAQELLPSEWGGEIEVVRTSATKGDGLDELLETILLTAELHEYKSNPERQALGTCLESEQESGRGVIAKVIVQNGTLKVGDVLVCGAAHGRVKALYDTLRPSVTLDEAGPSTPVNVTGFDIAPDAGDKFYVLDEISDAREIAASRAEKGKAESLSGVTTRISLEDFQLRLEEGNLVDERDVVELNLIVRADVRGSIEAIQKELSKIDHPEVKINILQNLVGGVTAADVRLAQASQAVIIGFNVVPDDAARSLADDLQVEIRRYDVIYKVTDDIKATLEGKLKPEEQNVELGSAMVLRTFSISRVGTIAGCRVMRGNIERNCRMRVIRESRIIGDYPIDTLKREKDDAKEVQRGMECGIKLQGFDDIKEGDTLEAYKVEEVARTLEV